MSTLASILIGIGSLILLLVITYLLDRWRLRKELASASQIVQTAVGPIEYIDVGSGTAVLHAHGMGGGFDHVQYCQFLIDAGFRVIVPSRPGYLRTPLTSGKTPRGQAEMYANLLDTLNIPQAAFYAISQGGASSLEFAQAYPERCLGLVFVSAFTRPPQSDEFRPVLSYLKALMSIDFVMWLLKPILVSSLISQARKALPPVDRQDAGKMVALRDFFGTISQANLRGQGLVNDFRNLFGWTGISLGQLTVPALLFHGTTDVFVRCEDSIATANDIPDARYVQLDGVGHEGFITRLDRIVPETLDFLRITQTSRIEF
ncbi:MAG TPA: alpha/beta hydrolase [Anaerolineales bacterium]